MLPLSYLAIPRHLTLPDEITDQILTALTYLSRSRLSNTISLGTSLLRSSLSNPAQSLLSLDQRLALFLILAAAYEDPGLVHHYRRKATWAYEEAVLALDATIRASIPTSPAARRSVFVDESPDAKYWGGDWGGDDAAEITDLRGWVNGIGDLLNVLAAYQSEVESHFARALHAPGSAAAAEGLAARLDCRARVVQKVGEWFGRRPESRGKRVSFVLQEDLPWREEDIVDAYAGEETAMEQDFVIEPPPSVFMPVGNRDRESTQTIWPTVQVGEDGDGEAYSSSKMDHQHDNTTVMNIQWPMATREYAVRPLERQQSSTNQSHIDATLQNWPMRDTPEPPLILYNDPDIFQRPRPATAGKDLNRGAHSYNQPSRSNEWPLMNDRFLSPESEWPTSPPAGLIKWPLNEHHIPGDVPLPERESPVTPNLPFEYDNLSFLQEAEKAPTAKPPVIANKDKAVTRKPLIKHDGAVNQPPNSNIINLENQSGPSKGPGPSSSKVPEETPKKKPEPQAPVKETPGPAQPTTAQTRIKSSEEKVVLDPFLVESGIWKLL